MSQPLETYLEKKRKAWIAEHPDKWTILEDTKNFQLARNERTGFLIGLAPSKAKGKWVSFHSY